MTSSNQLKYNNNKSMAKRQVAICPKCGVKHRVLIFYSGRPPLRLYCDACELYVSKNSVVGEHRTLLNKTPNSL